jgi:DNA-binding protein Alba
MCTQEKGFNEVILKAMGRAINKTVTIAEIIKRRIPNLHQITEISSTDITDVYEPLEEGLDTYVRPLSALLCSLALALALALLCACVRACV